MPSVPLHVPMAPRDPDEARRVVTPLELFFDLTFVVAVAQASSTLHHQFVDGHGGEGLVAFPIVFFAIWWAWMNFTWFASAFDTEDVVYRVATFVQMGGVLVFSAGVPRFLEDLDPSVAVIGYVVMRVGMVAQWLRAAVSTDHRACALRYAGGIVACQFGWVALTASADAGWWLAGAAPLAALELAVPVWAERGERTTWHPAHIAERYALFTIIVLGESVLAAAIAFQAALDAGGPLADLVTTGVGGMLIVSAMWWVYFDQPVERVLATARRAFSRHEGSQVFLWGYGHLVVFGGATATGVGLAVAVDQATGRSRLSDLEAALTLTLPVVVYLLAVWVLHRRYKAPGPLRTFACPVTAVLVLATSWTPEPALLTGVVLYGLVALAVLLAPRAEPEPVG